MATVSVFGVRQALRLGLSPYWSWASCQRAAGQAGLMGCPPQSGRTLPTLSTQKLPSLTQLPGGRIWPYIMQAHCQLWWPISEEPDQVTAKEQSSKAQKDHLADAHLTWESSVNTTKV